MSLQAKTLQRYRQFYPTDTLRDISIRTGIQITRVFRLFNGKTMKVRELEALEEAVTIKLKENSYYSRLEETLEEATAILNENELKRILDYIERKNLAKSYGKIYMPSSPTQADIA